MAVDRRIKRSAGPVLAAFLVIAAVVVAALVMAAPGAVLAADADETVIHIAYLTQTEDLPPVLANLEAPPADEGLAGAELAITDNNGTAKFLKQRFVLDKTIVDLDGSVDDAFARLVADGARLILLDLPAEDIARLARRPDARDVLLFNPRATDDSLRGADCSANLLHTMPSRAMLADALAQYLVQKRWTKWFLVTGTRPGDALYAEAVKRAAKRYGAKIVADKPWSDDNDARRTAQAEIPVFTQAGNYDIIIVADEVDDFGDYILYRTWEPKLVAGTQGLVPTNWHRTHEQWGASQLQLRFKNQSNRWMTPRDHANWAAVRAVGEAATRTRSGDPATLAAYIRSPDLALAVFRGASTNFRPWDGQLRQPILLAADRSMVAEAPLDGFLHPKTPLDTLGYDEPETQCKLGKK